METSWAAYGDQPILLHFPMRALAKTSTELLARADEIGCALWRQRSLSTRLSLQGSCSLSPQPTNADGLSVARLVLKAIFSAQRPLLQPSGTRIAKAKFVTASDREVKKPRQKKAKVDQCPTCPSRIGPRLKPSYSLGRGRRASCPANRWFHKGPRCPLGTALVSLGQRLAQTCPVASAYRNRKPGIKAAEGPIPLDFKPDDMA
jgi:hypothetical protein